MTNNNDQRILGLKKEIEIKKEKLSKSSRFTPLTNCSIELNGNRYNIQALNKDGLVDLLVSLNIYKLSLQDLELLNEYKISGYLMEEWITDVKSRVYILSRKQEEQQLKAMEAKLTKLLSNEKKVELEIDEIASMLNE